VTDDDGAFDDVGLLAINVNNVAPTATVMGFGSVNEGDAATVVITDQTDASPDDIAAGLHYAFDFDNDGTFELGDGTYLGSGDAATAVVPSTFLDDGPSARTIAVRVIDKDDGFTDLSLNQHVENVVPAFDAGPDANILVGVPFMRALSFVDPGTETLAPAGWIVTVDYGDGDGAQPPASFDPFLKTFSLDHPYLAAGIFTVTVNVDDQDGVIATDSFVVFSVPDGDFNDDGQYDCQDIDALTSQIASVSHNAAFDLTGDESVDLADRDAWLAEAGAANLASGNPYLLGDADLSGVVDFLDFNIWASNRFTNNPSWCSGDFNANGIIDFLDFNIWASNRFQSAALLRPPASPQLMDDHALDANRQTPLAQIISNLDRHRVEFQDDINEGLHRRVFINRHGYRFPGSDTSASPDSATQHRLHTRSFCSLSERKDQLSGANGNNAFSTSTVDAAILAWR
jgi:hypothetical protein